MSCPLVRQNGSDITREENSCCGVDAEAGTSGGSPKKPICSLVKQRTCCDSDNKHDWQSPKESPCSGVEQDRDHSVFAHGDTTPDNMSDQRCLSRKEDHSTGEQDNHYDIGEDKATTWRNGFCCTEADAGTDSDQPTGASSSARGRPQISDTLKKSCCEGSSPRLEIDSSLSDKREQSGADYLHPGNGASVLDHVILNVQGLTCTGCETKLFRSLSTIPGVRNIHTSLLASQAEFELDIKAAPSILEIIRLVDNATGFICNQRLNIRGQEIDIIVNGDANAWLERVYPKGVIQMIAVGKQVVRVTYDARIIGARDLLREVIREPCRLAAPRSLECESGKKHLRDTAWRTILSAVLTTPVLILAWAPLPPRPTIYGGCSLALASIVQLVIAGPFYPRAVRSLILTHVIEMDLLIVLSTSAAYIFSFVSFVYQLLGRPLPTGVFFETSTLLITFIMLGRLVSAFARQEAIKSVSIRSLQAKTALLCDADGHGDQEIDARLLQYGDFFRVVPDSYIVTDGVVTIASSGAAVDESMITGEFRPVEKVTGSSVIAGSLNRSGIMVVRLTNLPGHNTISTIAAMVDEAKFSKPKTQELVDIVASYFVPVILTLTIMTLGIWIAIGIKIRHESADRAVVNAITYGISVLIVSCPCAIGLAVPMVVVISGGVAARHGVIVRSAIALEIARKVSHVVFDKTGTLTRGQLCVVEEVFLSEDYHLVASVALGLTCNSKHPVSVAMSIHLRGKGVNIGNIEDYKSVTGQGVEGIFKGVNVRCGNTRWLSADFNPKVQDFLAKGLTVTGIAINGQLLAVFGLSDSLRPESQSVVAELQKRNIEISLVSGDEAGAVEAVAAKLGIPASHVRSRCMPGAKQCYVKNLMTDEKKTVIFCGDGSNDAVALATASVGVHMDNSNDMATNAADVVLTRPYLGGILVLLDLSKAAVHRMFLNFFWSFLYNLLAILLAAGAFVNVRIPPQYAGLGEIVSVLPIILIALQLRQFKREY